MSKKERNQLRILKSKAFKLRDNGQIPYSLYMAIIRLNYESDIKLISELSLLSEKYIRIGGFYIRHPEYSKECDEEIARLSI